MIDSSLQKIDYSRQDQGNIVFGISLTNVWFMHGLEKTLSRITSLLINRYRNSSRKRLKEVGPMIIVSDMGLRH